MRNTQVVSRTASPGSRRAGFSLLEAMIGMALLALAVGGFAASIQSGVDLGRVNRETALAHQAARQRLESIQAAPFGQVFRTFNEDPADDPGGPGTAPGNGFAVPGLSAIPGDADGLPGLVRFPDSDGPGGARILRESVEDVRSGMPRDLNADGVVDDEDHAGDYVLLPVSIRVEWRGASGSRSVELSALLSIR